MIKPLVIHDNSHRAVQALSLAHELEKLELKRRVIVTCGRDVIDAAVAAKSEDDILVSVLDPGREYDKFDLIFVPKHDPHPDLPNIRTTIGIINYINPQVLLTSPLPSGGDGGGRKQMINLPHPNPLPRGEGVVIAALIGGRHVGGNFSADDAAKLANIINKADCTALVTTSKRTEAKAVKVLRDEIWKTKIFYDYNSDGQAANPYLKILAAADKIIVTADSVRMCSEAASSGKQVFIFTPSSLHFSYAALRDSFFKSGAALDIGKLSTKKPTLVLNEAKRAAEIIQTLNYN